MIRLSTLLHARRRQAATDQGGFALAAVLAVIAFTGITIAALLGMMLTTMRVTRSQEEAAQDRRAADGAIENAIEKMRDVPCNPRAQPYLDNQQIGTRTVDVTCTSSTSGVSTTDQVRLVGVDQYRGAYREWTADCASNATDGCLPWGQVSPATRGSTGEGDVSLVHSGDAALRFDSGVTVRRGAVALRNPTNGNPAIEVGGEYHQGRAGVGGTGGTDCGLLSSLPAARIVDSSGSPDCGSPEAANIQADSAANVAGLLPPSDPVSVPANCGGPVVTFQPGIYSAALTQRVSDLTRGNLGSCQNKTFWFRPGIYSFQGSDLLFDSPGSYYVFGAVQGWDPAAGVQANPALVNDPSSVLCNPDVSGTSIVTAGWTRITHTRGRVAICPARPASATDPHPAIFQQTSVPTGVAVTLNQTTPSTPITQSFRCRLQNPFAGYFYPDAADVNDFGECVPVRRYTLNLATSGAADVDSLRVMLTGTEGNTPNNLIGSRRSRFTVHSTTGELCRTDWVTGMPNGNVTSSFDLKQLPGTCRSTTFNQRRLDGGRIVVEHRMQLYPNPLVPNLSQSMSITGAAVEVNTNTVRVRSASDVTSSEWSSPGAVAVADTAAATPILPCSDGVCEVADPGGTRTPAVPFTHSLTLGNFDVSGLSNPTSSIDPAITDLRAVLKITPSTGPLPPPFDGLFRIPTRVFVELRSPTGHRCVVQGEGMNSDQEIAIDLLDVNLETANGPGCNSMPFANVSDLAGVSMTVRFETPCVPDYNAPHHGHACVRNGSNVFQLRPPGIENVSLTVGTDVFLRVSRSTVTSNAVTGAAGATFNVHGMTWMPLTDLDIAWRGPATTAPLFGNDLVLNGLGSRMFTGAAMGTVCCNPPTSRTVELTASIDGVDRMVARVHFDDAVPAPDGRATVDVLRWLNCQGACASVLSESDTNPNAPP